MADTSDPRPTSDRGSPGSNQPPEPPPEQPGEGRLQLLAFSRASPRCVIDDMVLMAVDSRATVDELRQQFPDLPFGNVTVIDLEPGDLTARELGRFGNWG